VLLAEQEKMQDLLASFNKRQHEQLNAQQMRVQRTLESQRQTFEHVLESSLEKWATNVGGSLKFTGTEAQEFDVADRVASVGFDVRQGDVDGAGSVWLRTTQRVDTLQTHVDMQKLKCDFAHREAALSTYSKDKGDVPHCWDTLDQAHARILSCVSQRRWHFDRLACFVDGQTFRGVMAALIVVNAAYIGFLMDVILKKAIEGDDSFSQGGNDSSLWKRMVDEYYWVFGAELFFTTSFVLEIVLRVLALEGAFFVGGEAGWNMFDFVLTLSSVAEVGFSSLRVDLSFMRVIRITGIIRSFRVFSFLRMVPIMRSLRLMTLAIVKSFVPFVLAVLVLFEVIFVFSIVIAHGVAEHATFRGDDIPDDLRTYLGSISMTMLSLFMSVSGGIDWWTVGDILLHISTGYFVLFFMFILFTVLAVLNIITGTFVKEAQDMASKDHHVQLQAEFEENRLLLRNLKELFNRMDERNTGCVSLFDFERAMNQQDVRLRFAQVGLDIQDATSFFKILDQDDSEELSIEEFVMGCMRFKGRANRMDLEVMIMDTKKLMRKMARMNEKYSDRLGNIEDAVARTVAALR